MAATEKQSPYVVLTVDDDKAARETLINLLPKEFEILEAADGSEALAILAKQPVHLVFLDVYMDPMDGFTTLQEIQKRGYPVQVIMVSQDVSAETGYKAAKMGAFQYVTKPSLHEDPTAFKVLVKRALEKREAMRKVENYQQLMLQEPMIGESQVLKQLLDTAHRTAKSDIAILILGESGTGKDLLARLIHQQSLRHQGPFVRINCGGIPQELLESELFGHEAGSFTGAKERKLGKFELADGGTLFLDEIGNMSMALQSKLLTALDHHVIERVGGTSPIPVSVRILSATNRNLAHAMAQKEFRDDLYYRLRGIELSVPPLRERTADIPRLMEYFLGSLNRKHGQNKRFTPEALEACAAYPWPGNVRELRQVVEQLVILTHGEIIDLEHLPQSLLEEEKPAEEDPDSLRLKVAQYEKGLIEEALRKAGNNQSKAAELLKVNRRTLYTKIRLLHINAS